MITRIYDDLPASPAVWPTVQRNATRPSEKGAAPQSIEQDLQSALRQAEQASEAKVREARQAGVREGEERARAAAAKEMQGAMDRVAGALSEVAGMKETYRAQTEREVVKLSLAIARRILHRELSVDATAIEGIVSSALSRFDPQKLQRIRVNPKFEGALRTSLSKFISLQSATVMADPSLPTGGLVIETSQGSIDASVDTQLDEISRGLADRLPR